MSQKQEINIEKYVDQHRWLLNNGIVTDGVKNQIFFSGSIVHKDVQAVEVDIVSENKLIKYKIYVDKPLLKSIEAYKSLSKNTTLFGLWRFKRLLKKEGSLDFQQVLNKFVQDFCGRKWSVTVEIIDFSTYIETLEEQSETDGSGQQFNQLSD